MDESVPKKRKPHRIKHERKGLSLLQQRMREAHQAALEATDRELRELDEASLKKAVANETPTLRRSQKGKGKTVSERRVVRNMPKSGSQLLSIYTEKHLGLGLPALERADSRLLQTIRQSKKIPELNRIIAFVENFRARYPNKAPTWKQLQNGSLEERREYSFMVRHGLLVLLEHYKPYGDPKEYYALTHAGKSIGQVQEVDPSFVNYCRYHKITDIMPTQRDLWVDREVEEFIRRHGKEVDLGELLKSKEGRRSYMRVFRAGKLAALKTELNLPPPIKRKRKEKD